MVSRALPTGPPEKADTDRGSEVLLCVDNVSK